MNVPTGLKTIIEMKNITHLTHTDISQDSRILKELLTLSSNEGYNVCGIGVKRSPKAVEEYPFNMVLMDVASRRWRFLPRILRLLLTFTEIYLRLFFETLKTKPDVIHCHDINVLPVGVFAKLFTRSKLIYDAHELESNKNGIKKLTGFFIYWIEKIFWPLVDSLIVVSPSINEWYNTNLGHKETREIFNSPVIKNDDDYDAFYLKNRFSIPEEKRVFIYIGLLMQGRNIETLCKVFRDNSINSAIVFLGYGDLEGYVEEQSREHENIFYHPKVEHDRVVPIARSADFGFCLIENISLSDYYCLPNKFFEYTLSGLPVVSSNFPDLNKMVTHYNLGMLSELSCEGIKSTVQEIERDNLSFQINVSDLYPLTWGCQEVKLIELYERLLCEGES